MRVMVGSMALKAASNSSRVSAGCGSGAARDSAAGLVMSRRCGRVYIIMVPLLSTPGLGPGAEAEFEKTQRVPEPASSPRYQNKAVQTIKLMLKTYSLKMNKKFKSVRSYL